MLSKFSASTESVSVRCSTVQRRLLASLRRRLSSVGLATQLILQPSATSSDANGISNTIATTPTSTMESEWFSSLPVPISIESAPTSTVLVTVVVAPSPSPPPPLPAPWITPTAAGVAAVLVLAFLCAAARRARRRWRVAPPQKRERVTAALRDGQRVRIQGIVSRPRLNGRSGRIVSFDVSQQLYKVALDGVGEVIALRVGGVIPVVETDVDASAACSTDDGRMQAWVGTPTSTPMAPC